VQIHSAVPRIFHAQTKKHTLMEPKKQNLPQFTACSNKSKLSQDAPKNVVKLRKAVQHWWCMYSFTGLCWSYLMWGRGISSRICASWIPCCRQTTRHTYTQRFSAKSSGGRKISNTCSPGKRPLKEEEEWRVAQTTRPLATKSKKMLLFYCGNIAKCWLIDKIQY